MIFALVFLVWVGMFSFFIARTYQRATPGRALVRSGTGGTRVVTNAGVIVLPQLHEITWVSLSAMPIEVQCLDGEALPFQDGDLSCTVDFVLRVAPHEEAVLHAASTWGEKTLEAAQLQPLIEGQLRNAVRVAASQTTLARANADRTAFIGQTQEAMNDSFTNGLLLESIRFESRRATN